MLEGKLLHITNGDSFTKRLKDIAFPGDILTWREMLCEGPAQMEVFSKEFVQERCQFLKNYSDSKYLEEEYKTMVFHFSTLNFVTYDSVTLWFEYDLFCHINLAAVVYYFKHKHPDLPLFLVTSGVIEKETKLFGLNELSDHQLLTEAKKRTLLDPDTINSIINFWKIYTSSSHNDFLSIKINSQKLPYLSDCIQAHLLRFPDKESGLNALEIKVLNLISENEFLSKKQLIGYLLKNQEYYGFGDLQWVNIINKLTPFFTELLHLSLKNKGKAVINNEINVFTMLKDTTQFGGVSKYHYTFDKVNNKLSLNHEH